MFVDFGTTMAIAVLAVLVAFTVSSAAGLLIWLVAIPAGIASRRLRKGA